MIAFAYYLSKVILCSGILFLYYQAFLRNQNFHHWNRFYLLAAVVLSLALPLVKVDFSEASPADEDLWHYLLFLQSADRYMETFTVIYKPGYTAEDWSLFAYLAVSAALLIGLTFSLGKIIRLIRTHTSTPYDQFTLLRTREPGSPFSFLRYIFWNEEISLHSATGQQILHHEMVHVQEKHTWDKLFLQLVLVFGWCNPFFWAIRKELRFLHEFIADKKAVGNDTEAFAQMILQAAYPAQVSALRAPFFQTSIKRRLHMLTQNKNPKMAYVSRLIALPLMAAVTLSFTARTNANSGLTFAAEQAFTTDTVPVDPANIKSVNVKKDKASNLSEIEIYYKDGRKEVLTEKEARAKGLLKNEKSNQRTENTTTATDSSRVTFRSVSARPLYILDGKEVSMSAVDALNPTMISSINVLKGESAIGKYGEKGKSGVVEITLKKDATREPVKLEENGRPVMQMNGTSKVEMTESGDVKFEAKEIVVSGKKMEKNTGTGDDVVTVIGRKTGNEPVFEKTEFIPSVDPEEWRKFLAKQTQNVINSIGNKMPTGSYTVNVRFIVEKDGSLSNITILNDPGHGLGARVLEMMRQAPKWKPAIQNQHVVRSYHTQPITFVIADT